jgi:hypothetical protein
MIPWKYVIATFLTGIVLCIGYFVAARLHFQSIDFSIIVLKNMKTCEVLKDEERRLLFISESLKSDNLLHKTELQNYVDDQLLAVKSNLQTLYSDSENKRAIADKYEKDAREIVFYSLAMTVIAVIILIVANFFKIEANLQNQQLSLKFLRISNFLFSNKNQKEIFEPIIVDWQEEYFQALFKKEIWKARWINVRYTYAFLAATWQKSPIGDLIEFVIKIAKQ